MSDMGQDDIDKLLADALGGGAKDDVSDAPPDAGGAQSQDDIDALFAAANEGGLDDEDEGAEEPESSEEIHEDEGPASQDDIDALFAQVESDAAKRESKPVAEAVEEEGGPANQNDIDALFAAAGSGAVEEPYEPEPEIEEDSGGVQSQDDIDALLSGALGGTGQPAEEPAGETAPEPEDEETEDNEDTVDQDAIDALMSDVVEQERQSDSKAATLVEQKPLVKEPPVEPKTSATDDITSLLAGIEDDNEDDGAAIAEPESQDDIDALFASPSIEDEDTVDRLAPAGLEETVAAPFAEIPEPVIEDIPEPAIFTEPVAPRMTSEQANAARDVLGEDLIPRSAPAPRSMPEIDATESIRKSLSLMGSAGEVEGIAGQIAGLLGQLSERARRYQNVWMEADQEAKDLRMRYSQEQHRSASLQGELDSAMQEISKLRNKIGNIEGEKLAHQETSRTEVSALKTQIREQESRNSMLESEVRAIKEELERACTESTNSDLEERRSRFEADRLRGEMESERMERMRMQRALENREKEIQAMQAQSAGQASSLFLDELHRLVRRLESELDIRTAAAHEAMTTLERLVVSDDMVPMQSNLRAALQTAAGIDKDDSDALRSLSRSAAVSPKGAEADLPPAAKVDIVSFETAIASYDIRRATDIAHTLIKNGSGTPARLMEKIYRCQALRRPEITDKLEETVILLQGIRDVQESADRERSGKNPESERLYVQMFDYLHNLVRLKIITRSTASAWQFFLDLRGRFSFVTSDKQWSDHRDNILNS